MYRSTRLRSVPRACCKHHRRKQVAKNSIGADRSRSLRPLQMLVPTDNAFGTLPSHSQFCYGISFIPRKQVWSFLPYRNHSFFSSSKSAVSTRRKEVEYCTFDVLTLKKTPMHTVLKNHVRHRWYYRTIRSTFMALLSTSTDTMNLFPFAQHRR